MTITISGSNGITFSDSTTQSKGLTVVNFTRRTWSTKTSPGDFNSKQYPEGWSNIQNDNFMMIERVHPKSIFLVKWTMSMRTNYSDHLQWRCSWGGLNKSQGTMPYDAGFSANSRPFYSTFWLDAIPEGTLGTRPMVLEYHAGNGSGGERPSVNINPHRRNDDRLEQEYSSCTVYELAR